MRGYYFSVSGGNLFTIWTDHGEFQWIAIRGKATGRLARLVSTLQEEAFESVRRADIKHQAVDARSRLKTKDETKLVRITK